MSRVAIVGSCITRDLWPIRGDAAGLLYISRTSLPSLFAPPLPDFVPAPQTKILGRHQYSALISDLQKAALARLVAFQPTHLIVDFIDERFDLIAAGGTLVTHSWELEASGYLEQAAFAGRRQVPRLTAATERLWSHAAGQFAALVRATPLRNATLILHTARWATVKQGADGRRSALGDTEILPGRPADIAANNAMLERYETWFADAMPPMRRLAAPDHRVADEGHRWGLSPFHYMPGYYETIWSQLQALGVERPVSPAPDGPADGAPSGPGA